ncbi:hypothetical protein OIM90_22040 [Streptomyces sp. AD16]|nr:hypothetical protein OIM90_22040 [Streptomyces sp. AD16]
MLPIPHHQQRPPVRARIARAHGNGVITSSRWATSSKGPPARPGSTGGRSGAGRPAQVLVPGTSPLPGNIGRVAPSTG